MSTPARHLSRPELGPPGSPPSGPVVLHGVSWERYEALVALLGDDFPGLRLTYLEGTLEIMTTSPEHERWKKTIARLIEMWAVERNVRLNGYGSATFRKQANERGLEPDECYVLGDLVEVPDLAIEIVRTHGGIDKLDVYAGLGVPEVWLWEQGAFAVFHLEGDRYARRERSVLLEDLDLVALASFAKLPDQSEAVRAYRDYLRQTAG